MKVSRDQLLEIVRKLVKEALEEAGPAGYLSKTQRPDSKTMWNPNAQKQWVAGNTDPSSPGKPMPSAPGSSGPTSSTAPNSPPTNLNPDEKTVAGVPSAKAGAKAPTMAASTAGGTPSGTSGGAEQNSLADMSSMLQNASQDQIAQIMRILKGA